jgi:hypothetical protein
MIQSDPAHFQHLHVGDQAGYAEAALSDPAVASTLQTGNRLARPHRTGIGL